MEINIAVPVITHDEILICAPIETAWGFRRMSPPGRPGSLRSTTFEWTARYL
jgi:hypothetical protein